MQEAHLKGTRIIPGPIQSPPECPTVPCQMMSRFLQSFLHERMGVPLPSSKAQAECVGSPSHRLPSKL